MTQRPTALTSSDRGFLEKIGAIGSFHVTGTTEHGWIQIGRAVCSGLSSKGVSKYMAETPTRQYRAMLAVVPIAIGAYCPSEHGAYATWANSKH